MGFSASYVFKMDINYWDQELIAWSEGHETLCFLQSNFDGSRYALRKDETSHNCLLFNNRKYNQRFNMN